MKGSFFVRFLLVALGTSAVSLALVMLTSAVAMRGEKGRVAHQISGLLAAAINPAAPLASADPESDRLDFWWLDGSGKLIRASTLAPLPYDWSILPKPQAGEVGFFPPSQFESPELAVSRDSEGSGYFVVRHRSLFHGFRHIFVAEILAIFAVSASSVGFSLLTAFAYLRRAAEAAEGILAKLRSGNLEARFELGRFDALAGTAASFNHMADEISALVKRLKGAEEARTRLLRELGHDARTPMTSIRGFIENLLEHSERLDRRERDENLRLALSEMEYLRKLLDDQLYLAQLSDPNVQTELQELELSELLESELGQLRPTCEGEGRSLEWELPDGPVKIRGNALLIRRLLRNAVDNALVHARARVTVGLQGTGTRGWTLSVEDDGPGLSADRLQTYGTKRSVREPGLGARTVASIGMGSTIMRAIVELHGGTLEIGNLLDESGKVRGARVVSTFWQSPAPSF